MNKTTKQRKLKSGTYSVMGALWFDKVNGNTYNAVKIYDGNGEEVARLGLSYGYGDYYKYRGENYIKEHARKNAHIKIVSHCCGYMLQRDLKHFNF